MFDFSFLQDLIHQTAPLHPLLPLIPFLTIAADSQALAADFIDESERDGTKSNDAGRVPKLESDGYLSPAFIRDISARVKLSGDYQLFETNFDCMVVWDTEDFDTDTMHETSDSTLYEETDDTGEQEADDTDFWFAQEFTTGAEPAMISTVKFYLRHSQDESNTYELVLRSSLTGSDLASAGVRTFNPSGTSTTEVEVPLPPYKLEPNTTYYIVIKTVTYPSSGAFFCREDSAGAGGHTTSDGGSSWASTGNGFRMTINDAASRSFVLPTDGKYLVIANINSGVAADKNIKLWQNDTEVLDFIADSDGTVESGVSLQTLIDGTEDDIITLTIDTDSTASDDLLQEGCSFEIVRLR